jgi:hypothetical protein
VVDLNFGVLYAVGEPISNVLPVVREDFLEVVEPGSRLIFVATLVGYRWPIEIEA